MTHPPIARPVTVAENSESAKRAAVEMLESRICLSATGGDALQPHAPPPPQPRPLHVSGYRQQPAPHPHAQRRVDTEIAPQRERMPWQRQERPLNVQRVARGAPDVKPTVLSAPVQPAQTPSPRKPSSAPVQTSSTHPPMRTDPTVRPREGFPVRSPERLARVQTSPVRQAVQVVVQRTAIVVLPPPMPMGDAPHHVAPAEPPAAPPSAGVIQLRAMGSKTSRVVPPAKSATVSGREAAPETAQAPVVAAAVDVATDASTAAPMAAEVVESVEATGSAGAGVAIAAEGSSEGRSVTLTMLAAADGALAEATPEWVMESAGSSQTASVVASPALTAAAVAAAVPVELAAVAAGAVIDGAASFVASPQQFFHFAHLGSPLALLADSLAAFVEDSASVSLATRGLSAPAKTIGPWTVTFTVLAVDLVLLTYLYRRSGGKRKSGDDSSGAALHVAPAW